MSRKEYCADIVIDFLDGIRRMARLKAVRCSPLPHATLQWRLQYSSGALWCLVCALWCVPRREQVFARFRYCVRSAQHVVRDFFACTHGRLHSLGLLFDREAALQFEHGLASALLHLNKVWCSSTHTFADGAACQH